MSEFAFVRPDPEKLEVYLDGTLIASTNHDEHGWAGIDMVEDVVEAIAEQLGIRIVRP